MRAIAKYWTSFDPLRAMFAGNKAFAELKGKWGMENGRWKGEKKKLIFHFQREIKHNSDTDGERRCALSDWWLSEPPRGVSFGASLKLGGRTAKIHYMQQNI